MNIQSFSWFAVKDLNIYEASQKGKDKVFRVSLMLEMGCQ